MHDAIADIQALYDTTLVAAKEWESRALLAEVNGHILTLIRSNLKH